jgi:phage gp46-like protein
MTTEEKLREIDELNEALTLSLADLSNKLLKARRDQRLAAKKASDSRLVDLERAQDLQAIVDQAKLYREAVKASNRELPTDLQVETVANAEAEFERLLLDYDARWY